MTAFDLDPAKAELEKAKQESDAVDVELQRLLSEMRELREKGQRVPRAEAKARFSELINRQRLIGQRFLALARALEAGKAGMPEAQALSPPRTRNEPEPLRSPVASAHPRKRILRAP
jgi:hypothetical protein